MPKYSVKVCRAYLHQGYVEVTAKNAKQAQEKALGMIGDTDMTIKDIIDEYDYAEVECEIKQKETIEMKLEKHLHNLGKDELIDMLITHEIVPEEESDEIEDLDSDELIDILIAGLSNGTKKRLAEEPKSTRRKAHAKAKRS